MMGRPLVSVVMPVRNGARFLRQALSDVRNQTYTRHELVIVDGRSSDGSAEIATDAGARVIRQQGEGLPDAWNLAVAATRGSLLAFLDTDDRWAPEKLAEQVSVLERRAEVEYVLTHMRFFVEPGCPHPPGFRPRVLESNHEANMPSALMIRRSAFERVGPFRTDLLVASDIDWFARLKDLGLRREVIPRVLVRKRVHDANLSYFHAQTLNRELLGLLRESVARRRQVS
jgi:glycosyltransferase involved in cell wall biosynthesis